MLAELARAAADFTDTLLGYITLSSEVYGVEIHHEVAVILDSFRCKRTIARRASFPEKPS
jgi:hypothetical protein